MVFVQKKLRGYNNIYKIATNFIFKTMPKFNNVGDNKYYINIFYLNFMSF